MPRRSRKFVRCPYFNKNLWIVLETEKDINGGELLLCMTCKERDLLIRKEVECGVGCKNYFYSDDN